MAPAPPDSNHSDNSFSPKSPPALQRLDATACRFLRLWLDKFGDEDNIECDRCV
jgi:hypothetical protein